jgi:hypothetical protein
VSLAGPRSFFAVPLASARDSSPASSSPTAAGLRASCRCAARYSCRLAGDSNGRAARTRRFERRPGRRLASSWAWVCLALSWGGDCERLGRPGTSRRTPCARDCLGP